MDAIAAFAEHVVTTRYDDLPAAAVAAAKTFILDSFGVGVAGSAGPSRRADSQRRRALGQRRRRAGLGARHAPAGAGGRAVQRLPDPQFRVRLRARGGGGPPDGGAAGRGHGACRARGRRLGPRSPRARSRSGSMSASGLGLGSKAPLRFFRPATAGAFAATAAIGRLMGFDAATLVHAFGDRPTASSAAPCRRMPRARRCWRMQIGFNARNALVACDLAAAGLTGPQHVLEGPFGYLRAVRGRA